VPKQRFNGSESSQAFEIGPMVFTLIPTPLTRTSGLKVMCGVEFAEELPNKRLKLAARVDRGMNSSSARRSLSAIR